MKKTRAMSICAACLLTAFSGAVAACGAFARVDITAGGEYGPGRGAGGAAKGGGVWGGKCPAEVGGGGV